MMHAENTSNNFFLVLGKVTSKLRKVPGDPEAKIQKKTNGRKYKISYVYIRLILILIIFLANSQ